VSTPEELKRPLYRCVRGELPNSFWVSEDDEVCAVDTSFLSTSRSADSSKEYLSASMPNVMWELQPKPQSDSAFHCGASIRMLSQFAFEDEVLFPPCTMIVVKRKATTHPIPSAPCATRDASGDATADGKQLRPSLMEMSATKQCSSTSSAKSFGLHNWRKQRMRRFEVEECKEADDAEGSRSFLLIKAVPSFV